MRICKLKKLFIMVLAAMTVCIGGLAIRVGFAANAPVTVDFVLPHGTSTDGSGHSWYVNGTDGITREYDASHTIKSELSFFHEYVPGDLTRTDFYLGTDNDVLNLGHIASEHLTFTFWVYASRAVSFDSGLKIQLGNGGWGGWYLTPAFGAFSGQKPSLEAGWNFFSFSFGSDDFEYFPGSDPHFGDYEQNKNYSAAPFAQLDFWDFGVPAGEDSVSLWFDDFKFVDSSRYDEAVQSVTDETALAAVVFESSFGRAELAKNLTLTESLPVNRELELLSNNFLLRGKHFFSVAEGVSFRIDGKNFPFQIQEVSDIPFLDGDTRRGDWNLRHIGEEVKTNTYDATHPFAASAAMYGKYGTGSVRTSFYLGTDEKSLQTESIPSRKLALSFWVYASRAASFDTGLKIQLGNGGWGGWYLTPASGAFSGEAPAVEAGWNLFFFDLGSALAGENSGGSIEYWAGNDPHFAAYDSLEAFNEAPFAEIDLWNLAVADGKGDVELWFDDFRFVNTDRQDEIVQSVRTQEAYSAALEIGMSHLKLCASISAEENTIVSKSLKVDFNGYRISTDDGLFVVEPGGALFLSDCDIELTGGCAIESSGSLTLSGSLRIEGFKQGALRVSGIADLSGVSELSLSGIYEGTVPEGIPSDSDLNGRVGIAAILPHTDSAILLFSEYGRFVSGGLDYYYQKAIGATQVMIRTPERLTVDAGTSFRLEAAIAPFNVTFPEAVWSVSGNDRVTVAEDGTVTIAGDAEGMVTIRASSQDRKIFAELTFSINEAGLEILPAPAQTGWIAAACSGGAIFAISIVLSVLLFRKKRV